MQWLRTVFGELWGLFVDDSAFALAIVIWLVVCRFAPPLVHLPQATRGPILFAGLAIILAESALRRSRH
ncbi:hypothetical protein [Paraburkholderia tropica]|uniref:hypothetical protein n=1 Tax=Paraburkholderia tropica TaxID=92647 RepID=UPI002AB7B6AC|nr:hypothetical protein [Paraburkholderia tropica]